MGHRGRGRQWPTSSSNNTSVKTVATRAFDQGFPILRMISCRFRLVVAVIIKNGDVVWILSHLIRRTSEFAVLVVTVLLRQEIIRLLKE